MSQLVFDGFIGVPLEQAQEGRSLTGVAGRAAGRRCQRCDSASRGFNSGCKAGLDYDRERRRGGRR